MKRLVVLLVLVVLAVGLIPGVAAADIPRTGSRIIILGQGDQTFSAGEPFHVRQGWTVPSPDLLHTVDFDLFIDGREVHGPVEVSFVDDGSGGTKVIETSIFNFRKGLPPGAYVFTGCWTDESGPFEWSITVTFTE